MGLNWLDLSSGDLIGVSASQSQLSQAISASHNSRGEYDHIGVVECADNEVYVWNANQTLGVCRETLSEFIARESNSGLRRFDVYRCEAEMTLSETFNFLKENLGLPYNHSFRTSDKAFYCADLIARAYPPNFFKAKPMRFPGAYWTGYFQKLGTEVPHGELGFHPADMLAQEDLILIGEL